jgi:flavin reductase (DIM6/NTAB) family NADH-FMN oxidoreductase RutF
MSETSRQPARLDFPMNSQRASTFVTINPDVLYFGTPVAVVSTCNRDGTTNLAAMSSFWALGDRFIIGLGSAGQTAENLARTGECVLNFPSPDEWQGVEKLASTTGKRDRQPYHDAAGIRTVVQKFAVSGFASVAAKEIAPLRVADCPIQVETRVLARHVATNQPALLYFELRKLLVHVREDLLDANGRVAIERWSPLFYVFRHYFGKGVRLGRSYRAQY